MYVWKNEKQKVFVIRKKIETVFVNKRTTFQKSSKKKQCNISKNIF